MTIRPARLLAALAVVAALTTACTQSVAGQAVRVGAGSGTESHDPPTGGRSGLKDNAPRPSLRVQGAASGNKYDSLAEATIDDLYTYYRGIFQEDFGKQFTEAKALISYDSKSTTDRVCGAKLAGRVNASYVGSGCDTIIWDRGVLMPMMEKQVGELSAPTILAHEMGHLVQARLGVARTSTLLLEQQADCYAGSYWRWVADGNSKYFDFSSADGIRGVLTAMMWVGDPVGLGADNAAAHGNSFDRSFAAAIGYANGPKRCNEISQQEVDQRSQQTGFDRFPTNFGNIEVTDKLITQVTTTLDLYFGQTVPGYSKPKLQKYDSGTPPTCLGSTPQPPVDYCPATRSVRYNLAQLKKIGTPTATWRSTNGDFSAIILIASRYALAAQATGGGVLTGDQAGLRGLCYAGTWARWLRDPRGPDKLKLSPNDLNKAVYEVVSSPLAAGDVNSKSGSAVLDQVQALHIGVVYDIRRCFDFYGHRQ